MKYVPTRIPDVVEIFPDVFEDDRGYFMESFRCDSFEKNIGKKIVFCQDNESFSTKNTLRGLHYQLPPYAQNKLVRVVHGTVLDVAVDIRKHSPTFMQYVAVELSAAKKNQLFIPAGFAHGFVVRSNTALFLYKVDAPYAPAKERCLLFSDPDIGIDWGGKHDTFLVSKKDAAGKRLREMDDIFEDE